MKKNEKGKTMKNYNIKINKRQLAIMKEAWKQLQKDEDIFSGLVMATEKWMEKETGIKDLEFFMCDNSYVGIGNADRTMKLIQREKLES